MTNTIFTFKNPNPPITGPVPDPTKPRYIKAVIREEEISEPKRFAIVQEERENEPARRFVLEQKGE